MPLNSGASRIAKAAIALVCVSALSPVQADPAGSYASDDAVFVRKHLPGGRRMTRLLAVQFNAGRPKLSPGEETTICSQTAAPSLQSPIRNPAAMLVVIGYSDLGGESVENKRAAFRRAQLVIDLLRDKCGLAASIQPATLEIADLPVEEQASKQRVVEVWVVDP